MDWEITPDGLYIATRHFLLRRGYCCANHCRNCPYVNWHNNPDWQHAPAALIKRIRVPGKTLREVQAQLALYEQACAKGGEEDANCEELLTHYRLLLERWR